jgi:hypothetical protein
MRKNWRYRIKTATIAIFSSDGRCKTVTVPVDEIVTVTEIPPEGDRLINVTWNNQDCMMFTQDLHNRGEALDREPIGSTRPEAAS